MFQCPSEAREILDSAKTSAGDVDKAPGPNGYSMVFVAVVQTFNDQGVFWKNKKVQCYFCGFEFKINGAKELKDFRLICLIAVYTRSSLNY